MNRFTFTPMNYSIDRPLNALLTKAMDSGIKTVTGKDSYYLNITFKDGSHLNAWNVNKYYAWLSRGRFTYPNKEDGEYNWNDARPSRSTMARLYKMLGSISYCA